MKKSIVRYRIILLALMTSMATLLLSPLHTQAGVDAVTQATVTFWPQSYAKLWGEQREANLQLLRTFREEVLNATDAGREITRRLYDNSLELSLLLVLNPALSQQAKKIADELLPAVETRLCTGKAVITRQAVNEMLALLDAFAAKASPKLQKDLGHIKDILCAGAIMDELQVVVIK
jgi:hypothetical protein